MANSRQVLPIAVTGNSNTLLDRLPPVIEPHVSPADLSRDYSLCLVLRDPTVRHEYNTFKRTATSGSSALTRVFLSAIFVVTVATKSNLESPFNTNDPLWLCFQALSVFLYAPMKIWKLYMAVVRDHFVVHKPDLFLVATVLFFLLLLVSRTLTGQCDPGATLWTQQKCNPHIGGLPIESNLIFAIVPFIQVSEPGARWIVVAACHVVALATLMGLCFHLQLLEWPYILFYYCASMLCSYEIERERIHAFLNSNGLQKQAKEILAQSKEIIVQAKHIDDMNIKAREEKIVSLKDVLGCVAHDLQTPIQAILMDIEFALSSVKRRPKRGNGGEQGTDLQAIEGTLREVRLAAELMSTNIRRALEFIKSESDVALVPVVTPFDVNQAATLAIHLVSALKKASCTIDYVAVPCEGSSTQSYCPVIFSDRAWLMDNILCLLSNAVKYSSRNAHITLTVDVVPMLSCQSSCSMDPGGFHQASLYATDVVPPDHLKMIRFRVVDNGIGIPVESRGQLFQPFSTLQKMAGGTGLGLFALAKRVITMRGCYGMASRSDGRQGSVFFFAIPYRPDTSIWAETSVQGELSSMTLIPDLDIGLRPPSLVNICNRDRDRVTEAKVPVSVQVQVQGPLQAVPLSLSDGMSDSNGSNNSNTGSKNSSNNNSNNDQSANLRLERRSVLLVDDSVVILKSIERALQRAGFDVVTAENGLDALDEYFKKDARFDIVCSDVQMPVMDGLELSRRLRAIESQQRSLLSTAATVVNYGSGETTVTPRSSDTPKVVFALMSANSSTYTRQISVNCDVDFVLEKPFSLSMFVNAVSEAFAALKVVAAKR